MGKDPDVATGTGEFVIAAGRALGGRGVAVGLDFCGEMLDQGRRKVASDGKATVAWIQGRAEALPFRAETFDCVTVGFALRHANRLSVALREIARVLKPGGRAVVLESPPAAPLFELLDNPRLAAARQAGCSHGAA